MNIGAELCVHTEREAVILLREMSEMGIYRRSGNFGLRCLFVRRSEYVRDELSERQSDHSD